MNCTHPDHNEQETCADRAVSCHADCHCCRQDGTAPAYDENDVALLLNLVTEQKDEILKLINGGHKVAEAKVVLQILRPLWQSVGYSYKYNEIMQTIYHREASRED